MPRMRGHTRECVFDVLRAGYLQVPSCVSQGWAALARLPIATL